MCKKIFLILMLLSLSAMSYADLGRMSRRVVQQADRLQDAVDDYQYGTGTALDVERVITRMESTLQRMRSELNNPPYPPYPPVPAPITASCSLDVGGNFFTPWSKIECSVFGLGAVSYEVEVRGRVRFQGQLNPGQAQQSFITKKEKVGGHGAGYSVFVRTTRGLRILVSTL